jgi:acetyl-CoA carboxylase biotin carboxylase subunit
MEMNTRIQVEHPRHRAGDRPDLVLCQLTTERRATDIRHGPGEVPGPRDRGRINAEDPDRNFMPTPGRIETFRSAGRGLVRVDTAAYQSYVIPPHYDSLVAKVLTHGNDRPQAIARMRAR